MTDELLTDLEHEVVHDLGQVWNKLCKMVERGRTRGPDLDEAVAHVHALQHFVMSQAAARAYPDKYRLLGTVPDEPRLASDVG